MFSETSPAESHYEEDIRFQISFLREESRRWKCQIRLALTYGRGLEFRFDDAPTPPSAPSLPPPSPRNLQPTFSSCAAAAGKVAGALSQALAFNAARAPLRHKEGRGGGSPNALLLRSLGAGSRVPTDWREERGLGRLGEEEGAQ